MPPEPNPVLAFLEQIERILTRHAVAAAYVEPNSDDEWIVICRCKARFDAGESHAIHQTRVIRGWMAIESTGGHGSGQAPRLPRA
jgi:hypothetical protein